MIIRMVLEGADELRANLLELPRTLARNTLRRTLLKAAQPMRDAMLARLPSKVPWRNEYVVAGYRLTSRAAAKARRAAPMEVFVYVGTKPKRHLHLLEFGSGPRYTKDGRYRGRMTPDPFVRPGFDATVHLVLADFGFQLGREIEATAARLNKRNAKRAAKLAA